MKTPEARPVRDLAPPGYSLAEEIANAVTHGLGAVLSLVGLVLMVAAAAVHDDPWALLGAAVFGASLFALYLASTLYHALPRPAWKRWLQRLDHAAIFLLIAGSYTPFTLVNLRDDWGLVLAAAVWSGALAGAAFKLWARGDHDRLSAVIYLALGWMIVLALKPLIDNVEPGGVWLLVAGGLSYSVGVVFYFWHRLPFNHAIWHLFVLGGSVCHFLSAYWYVFGAGAAG